MAGLDISGFEFIDLGCGRGDSLRYYGRCFNAEGRGLGLDSNETKVKEARAAGLHAEVCDIIELEVTGRVNFCVMSHFLEHIADIKKARQMIRRAVSFSREFVLISQPWFDADPYLFREGFKLFWSDWWGHPNHMTLLEFRNILQPFLAARRIKRYTLYGFERVQGSADPAVLNLDEPPDSPAWTEGTHGPKRDMAFTEPVFREVMALLDINGKSTSRFQAFAQAELVYDSRRK